MKAQGVYAYGVFCTTYIVDKGEGLDWHNHTSDERGHGHFVIQGKTLVEIEGMDSKECVPGQDNLDLPCELSHRITAIEDGTIFVNIQPQRPAKTHGV